MGVEMGHRSYVPPSKDIYINYIYYQNGKMNTARRELRPSGEETNSQDVGYDTASEIAVEGSQYPDPLANITMPSPPLGSRLLKSQEVTVCTARCAVLCESI